MGIFDWFKREKREVGVTPNDLINGNVGSDYGDFPWFGNQNYTGIPVTPGKVLGISAVYRGINIIANTISSFPTSVFEDADQGKRKMPEHPIHRLLRNPNTEMTQSSFWRAIIANAVLHGTGYAYIIRDEMSFEPVELVPIRAEHVEPKRQSGQLVYVVEAGKQTHTLYPHQLLALPMLSLDGIKGMSIVELFKNSHGLSLAAEKYPAKYFSNGATPKMKVKVPGAVKELSDKAIQNLRESFNGLYTGSDNAHNTIFLPYGMDAEAMSHSPKDSMLLELRQFQVKDVARILGVPPYMLGEAVGGLTYANIEAQNLVFLQDTIEPWLVSIEQEINRKLFTEDEQGRYYVKFNTDSRLRSDTKTRYEAYNIAKAGGWLTLDEIRELEDRPPLPPKAEPEPEQPTEPAAQDRAEPDTVRETLELVLRNYAEQVAATVAAQIGSESLPDLTVFADRYLQSFRHRAATGQLDAKYELHRAKVAFTREAYALCGVKSVRWVGADCCDQCRQLAGKVVPITEPFIRKGEGMPHNVYHAPISTECRCTIEPVTKGEK